MVATKSSPTETSAISETSGISETSKASATSGSLESAQSADHDVASLSYEQARDELVRVVSELEQGSSSLEQSLALWERGEALAERCEEWLIGAKSRLDAARRHATPRAADSDSPGSHASGSDS